MEIGDQELSRVCSIDVHNQDLIPLSGDEGSLGFDPPDVFMGTFGYSRDHRGVELGAMSISIMGLLHPQNKSHMATPAPTRVCQEIPTIQRRQSAGIPRKLRQLGI